MWHLLLCNLKGRRTYNAIMVSAVALALTVVLVATLMTGNVRHELESKQLLLGPELALVPPGTKETGHIYLTKGPPAQGDVPSASIKALRAFPEVEAVSAQRLLGIDSLGGTNIQLLAFDPATDFMVLPWLKDRQGSMPIQGQQAILGHAFRSVTAESITLHGKPYTISGYLRHTGSFMDNAAFVPMPEADMASPSWVLVGITPGTSVDMMVNKFETNIPGVEVITRPELLKTIQESLHGVVDGGGLDMTALLTGGGAFLITAGLFGLLIHERRREFGLLKSMGARNGFVFRLIISEACALGLAGGVLGLVCTALWCLTLGATELNSTLTAHQLLQGGLLFGLTIAICVGAALVPALLAARMEPYTAIRSGEM